MHVMQGYKYFNHKLVTLTSELIATTESKDETK